MKLVRRLLTAVLIFACGRPVLAQATTVALPSALDRVLRDYELAWREGNGARLASLFTTDGMAIQSGEPIATGHAAIAASIKGPGGALQLRALSYSMSDSIAYIVGSYTYEGTTGGPMGRYVLALRKGKDGRWLIAADMDNSARR